MSESRRLWEQFLRAGDALDGARGVRARKKAKLDLDQAFDACLAHEREALKTSKLAIRRLESMRDFDGRFFDDEGTVR